MRTHRRNEYPLRGRPGRRSTADVIIGTTAVCSCGREWAGDGKIAGIVASSTSGSGAWPVARSQRDAGVAPMQERRVSCTQGVPPLVACVRPG